MTDESVFQNSLDELVQELWPNTAAAHHTPELLNRYAGLCAVFADWLEEQGDWRAAGYRWLCRHCKFPRRSINTWDWWRYGDWVDCAAEDLPSAIWDRLPGQRERYTTNCKRYPTRRDAESAICKAVFFLEPDA